MFLFCCTLNYVRSSIAITLMGKRELLALLNLSSWCLVMVERLFLAVPWDCLRFVIVVFPDILTYYYRRLYNAYFQFIFTFYYKYLKYRIIYNLGNKAVLYFNMFESKREKRNSQCEH